MRHRHSNGELFHHGDRFFPNNITFVGTYIARSYRLPDFPMLKFEFLVKVYEKFTFDTFQDLPVLGALKINHLKSRDFTDSLINIKKKMWYDCQ